MNSGSGGENGRSVKRERVRERERERGLAFETGMGLLIILGFFYLAALVLSAQQAAAKLCCLREKYGKTHLYTLEHTHIPQAALTFLHDPNHGRGGVWIHKIQLDLSSGA